MITTCRHVEDQSAVPGYMHVCVYICVINKTADFTDFTLGTVLGHDSA